MNMGPFNTNGQPLTLQQQIFLDTQRRALERAMAGMGMQNENRNILRNPTIGAQYFPDQAGQPLVSVGGVSVDPALARVLGYEGVSFNASQQPQESSGMEGITAAPQGPLDTPTATPGATTTAPGPVAPPVTAPAPQQAPSPTTQGATGPITAQPQGPLDVPIAGQEEGGEAPEALPQPQSPAPQGMSPQAQGMPIRGGALWKPVSESDGNLVMLFPYRAGNVVIKDAATGEVIDVGRSTGPSNGYGDTVRFSKPGAAYRNVIVEDSFGNRIAIKDGAQRIEGIEVSGYGFPMAQPFVMPPLQLGGSIEATPKTKRMKGPTRKLRPADYQAPKAPTTERKQGESRAKEQFMKMFERQRGR